MNLFFSRFYAFTLVFLSFVCQVTNAQELLLQKYLKDYNSSLYNNPDETKTFAEYFVRNSTDKSELIEAYILLANANYFGGKYNEALDNAAKANTEAIIENNTELIKESEFVLNKIYQRYNLLDFSEKYLINNSSDENSILQANQYFYKGDYSNALKILTEKKSLNIEEQITLSKLYLKNHLYNKAFQLLSQLERKQDTGNYFKARIYLLLGEYYFDKRSNTEAVSYYQKGLLYAKKINHSDLIKDAYYNLASLFLANHNVNEFDIYNEKYDSITTINSQINQEINNSIFHHQSKIIEVKKLKKEKLYHIISGGSIILLLLILVIYSIIINKKNEKIRVTKTIINTLKEAQEEKEVVKSEVKNQIKTDLIPREKEEIILQKIASFEQTNKFLSKNVSLGLIASQLDTNTKYLSDIINRHKQKNFNTYINELRIKYILNKLTSDSNYLNYKISYLAEESGFSSHSSFVSAFKAYTGTTPTIFIQTINQSQA